MGDDAAEDPKKKLCNELASKLEQRPNRYLIEITLKHSGLLGPAEQRPPGAGPPREPLEEPSRDGELRPVSIWRPEIVDGKKVFVRPDRGPLGDGYPLRKSFPLEKSGSTKRICFFGESVAVGFLYEPHLTPAKVLEEQLQTLAGPGSYEVIDLAKSNESLVPLVATVKSALQLEPDLLVVFAGNNWNVQETEVSPYIPHAQSRRRYAAALREGGIAAVRELGRREVTKKTRSALAVLARVAGSRSIPVVLVVPEVNLADWESRQPVVWRKGSDTARWHELYDRAAEELEQERWQDAISSARELLAIDEGTCPSTYRILALANLGLGRVEEARRACRSEVDSDLMPTMCFLHGPQATSLDQDVLRSSASEHGFACVDLPKLFAERSGASIPGRRLFLDYCHLTTEGTKIAMAAVAAEVLRLSETPRETREFHSFADRLPEPRISPEADATAKLGAAIHNAHRLLTVGPKAPIVEHWCQAALAASPGIEQTMLDLIEMRCSPCPEVATDALRRNLASPYPLMLQHGLQWPNLDVELIEAICNTLEENGRSVREKVTDMLVEHRGVGSEPVELALSGFFHWQLSERFCSEVLNFDNYGHRATYRSPWPASSFALVCDGSRALELDATMRLPMGQGAEGGRSGRVVVEVNGHRAGVVDCSEKWRREICSVEADWLKRGINQVTVRWPLPTTDGDEALRLAASRLERGVGADVHPVFGELFSLVATRAS